jgi:hypothetical protein
MVTVEDDDMDMMDEMDDSEDVMPEMDEPMDEDLMDIEDDDVLGDFVDE